MKDGLGGGSGSDLLPQTVLRSTVWGDGVRVRTVWEESDKKKCDPQTVERGSTVRAI